MYFLEFYKCLWYGQEFGGNGKIGSCQFMVVKDLVVFLVLMVTGDFFAEAFGRL